MENKIAIEPIENALVFLGSSLQAKYVQRYAMALGAKMVVVETEYVDEDYLLILKIFIQEVSGRRNVLQGGHTSSQMSRTFKNWRTTSSIPHRQKN